MCRYNMFNHYFFDGEKAHTVYMEFLRREELVPPSPVTANSVKDSDILVVLDPPFGGLVDALAATLKRITEDYCQVNAGICLL
jgi:hypothetical protein